MRSMVKGARRARSGHLFLVTAGLDPAVHSDRPRVRIRCMDCRVTRLRHGPVMMITGIILPRETGEGTMRSMGEGARRTRSGHLFLVTAGLDPAVHSDRQRIWRFRIAPSRFARSQACAGLPAMLSSYSAAVCVPAPAPPP